MKKGFSKKQTQKLEKRIKTSKWMSAPEFNKLSIELYKVNGYIENLPQEYFEKVYEVYE
jgi:hypothetical protein